MKTTDKHVYKRTKVTVLGGGYQSGGPKFKAFAAGYGLDLTEEEAAETIADYRRMNPLIVRYWRDHHDALAFSARRRDETHQVELASGRILTYFNPLIRGREIEVTQVRGEPRIRAYGGLLTENEMQSTCRDILCHAWRAVSKAGIRIVLTVHDELVAEVPIRKADWAAETMRDLMCHGIPWADGLPLGVDIVIAERYEK